MDQFKTRISNFKSSFLSETSSLIFYVRLNDIVVYQIIEVSKKLKVQFEVIEPINESVTDAINNVIKILFKNKSFNSKLAIQMVIDDHYLTMHRFNFTKRQMINLDQTLDIEIDQLEDYEYAISHAPSEKKDLEMLLVYLIKRSTLNGIESVFKSHKLKLKSIISRYQGFQFLFNNGSFNIEPKKPAVIVDISQTRVRLYIVLNDQIKVYRRMVIRIDEDDKSPAKILASVMSTISSFVEISIESYLNKFTNQSIDTIYFISDVVYLSTNLKKYKIKNYKLKLLPIRDELLSFKNVERKVTFLFAYAKHFMITSNNNFNLIPNLKRFEKKAEKVILAAFIFFLLFIFIKNGINYYDLKSQYTQFLNNRSQQLTDNSIKRREMVALRNRISQQKKVIDFADLTTKVFRSNLNIDDLLYQLITITPQDMTFKTLQIRAGRVDISGTSSSENGNYSFYIFLQQLENFPNFDRVRYNLGMDKDSNRSTFYVEFYIKSK